MPVGERIRAARKSAGLTQAQLAEKSGVASISIHQYESGKRQPRIEQLKKIGSSCDWSRERFTMDEGLSKAVVKAFINLLLRNQCISVLFLLYLFCIRIPR